MPSTRSDLERLASIIRIHKEIITPAETIDLAEMACPCDDGMLFANVKEVVFV
jgi:hypothetical protein